jgi:hypothetical protein
MGSILPSLVNKVPVVVVFTSVIPQYQTLREPLSLWMSSQHVQYCLSTACTSFFNSSLKMLVHYLSTKYYLWQPSFCMISPLFLLLLPTCADRKQRTNKLAHGFWPEYPFYMPTHYTLLPKPATCYVYVCVHCNEWELDMCMLVAVVQDMALFIID